MYPFEERRVKRSQNRDVALGYQLENVLERGRMEALVLADDQGLALATAGAPTVCRELAAFAPLIYKSILGMQMPPMLRGAEVAVRLAHVYGESLYMASVGGGVARDALLAHSIRGVKRILASN